MGILTNKKIIVTGATSGIGQAIAVRCAREGADVAFCGLTAQGADVTSAGIEQTGRRGFFKVVDLADLDAARQFVREAIEALGGLDGLVNNAGANLWHGVANSTYEQLDHCFHVNFYHAWAISQGVVKVEMMSFRAER